MAACSLGLDVVMTEPTDWVGGQLTAQCVPSDEHPWIEQFGCTARYRRFRDLVREYYREHLPLSPEARANPHLNPGGGWVSRICFEPRIGHQVLQAMLQPHLSAGRLDLRLWTVPIGADVQGDTVRAVRFQNTHTGDCFEVEAPYVLDATELGDLLPMTGTEYRLGSESKAQTGEPHALDGEPEVEAVQAITWVAAIGYEEGADHTIEKPAQYERWRNFRPEMWPGNLLSFTVFDPNRLVNTEFPLFSENWFNLFSYRQIIRADAFLPGAVKMPASIMNWPQNDYFMGTILDVPSEVAAARLEESRQLTLSVVYWLQTEAPRHDGGVGYRGICLRPDLTDTPDGLAKYPYIRESRRMEARFMLAEQHVAAACLPGRTKAADFPDSVGVGAYRIDHHMLANGRITEDQSSLPYQIPLGSLIPVRMRNLLPASKNLGVTHYANGCTRLHPVEWNIGESAGLIAAHCLKHGLAPAQLHGDEARVQALQKLLVAQGVELDWPQLRPL